MTEEQIRQWLKTEKEQLEKEIATFKEEWDVDGLFERAENSFLLPQEWKAVQTYIRWCGRLEQIELMLRRAS